MAHPDTPRIFVAYTGGTVGMHRGPKGYAPKPGWLQHLMEAIPQFGMVGVSFDIRQYDPLLDSSNMTPRDWLAIAQDIWARRDDYDGFLVLHGTDTMAFTASALSFLLIGLNKLVVLTGSQIPLEEVRNDAQDNLLASLEILRDYHDRIPEVCLYFGHRLYRGSRATKVHADGFEAFASPDLPPLATVGIKVDVNWDLVLPPIAGEVLGPTSIGDPTISAFRLFPGIHADYVETLLRAQGVVLECYGAGNAPHRNTAFMEALRRATERGVVIVDVAQPLRGTVDLGRYATGRALREAGVVGGWDLTTEAALTKLFFLFDWGLSVPAIERLAETPLVGELTRPGGLEGAGALDELLEARNQRYRP